MRVPNIAWSIFKCKSYWLLIWNSNVPGLPVFLFSKSQYRNTWALALWGYKRPLPLQKAFDSR